MSGSARLILRPLRPSLQRVNHTFIQPLSVRDPSRDLTTSTYQMAPKFLAGADSAVIGSEIDSLLSSGWNLTPSEDSIEKTYYFKTYTKVLDMHHTIGVASKARNHHATMVSKYGSLNVTWTTHEPAPGGLGNKDVRMAKWCDEQAKLIGTVDKSDSVKCGPALS
jgi:4a-hydroxytetrahydrobiopterin dehydratase